MGLQGREKSLMISLSVSIQYWRVTDRCVSIRADTGSVGHESWVKWINKSGWVTWVMGQYPWPVDPWL